MSKKGLVIGLLLLIFSLVSAGCDLFQKPVTLESGTLLHDGFDFSEGVKEEDWEKQDGRIVWWTPSSIAHPDYPRDDEYLWWDNAFLDEDNYIPQIHHFGEVSIETVVKEGIVDVDWDEAPTLPLFIDHVYAAKCRDGYVIFVVKSITLFDVNDVDSMPSVDVKYVFSTSADFPKP